MERDQVSGAFPLGSAIPRFELQGVDGAKFSSGSLSGAKATLIVFTCNHCPYVQGSDAMFIETAKRFMPDGLKVVAISSNDPGQYPEDSFEKMKDKSKRLGLPYPYLFDETQDVARSFDAQCTPECYLFNGEGKLVYHGAINDSPRDPSRATKNFLADAVATTLEGGEPKPGFVHPIGCSIKWRR